MTQSPHVTELAELYALGTLDERERALVDAHVRGCDACAARLGEAEATVAQLVVERTPSRELDRRMRAAFTARTPLRARLPWRWAAPLAAAAFVLGLIPSLLLWSGVFGAGSFAGDQQQAVQAMVNSHFAHAPFVPVAPDAPKAKLIYGRTGGWRYIVAQTAKPYDVAVQSGAQTVSLGKLRVSGNAAVLFIERAPAAREYLLREGSRIVARVTLPYRR
jgi:hypothetical protein